MGHNMSNGRRNRLILYYSSLFIVLTMAFNNCGQSGDLTIVPPEVNGASAINTDGGGNNNGGGGNGGGGGNTLPPGGTNPPPPVQYTYVNKSKMVTVGSTLINKVDLLVVIDNSGSMRTEQANMAARFSTLIDQLNGLDWQIAVITTDVSSDANLKDGRIIAIDPNYYIINSTMDVARAKADFARVIQRSETGSGSEQGIKATYRALQRALDPNNAAVDKPNRDFIRPNAALAVLVVTDANETPNLANDLRNSGDNLFQFVYDSWQGTKSFVFNSIVVKSGDSACLARDGNEDYGRAYELLSVKTEGIIGTVCATDYGSQLQIIGEKVVQQVRSILLECSPADGNGDGMPDVGVFESVQVNGGLSPAVLGQEIHGYTIQGTSLVFQNYLPEGSYEVKYVCRQAVQ